ncbi:MAG: hypothetical protein KAV00_09045 [Phycisphaerae bacterium]|nr:hypothetical protein [Phycisphaerae bacterium]
MEEGKRQEARGKRAQAAEGAAARNLEIVCEASRVLGAMRTALSRPGESVLCGACNHRSRLVCVLAALRLDGFEREWEPHRTAGPEVQNLRVIYRGDKA